VEVGLTRRLLLCCRLALVRSRMYELVVVLETLVLACVTVGSQEPRLEKDREALWASLIDRPTRRLFARSPSMNITILIKTI
jgi:hypothetical protein